MISGMRAFSRLAGLACCQYAAMLARPLVGAETGGNGVEGVEGVKGVERLRSWGALTPNRPARTPNPHSRRRQERGVF
jgi:hypothetical protein